MQRKTMMGAAAVAAVVALLYMRKRSADSQTADTSGVMTSNAALLNAAMGNVANGFTRSINVNVAPSADGQGGVADTTATAPAPEPPRAVFGGTMPGASSAAGGYLDADGVYHYPDGSSAYTGGGTFGHLTEDQRKGKTDGQLATGILGY